MDPADEFARPKAEIRRLQDRANALKAGFLKPEARLRPNRLEVTVKRQKSHVFLKERLPEPVQADPQYCEERDIEVVTCHEISSFRAGTRISS